MEKRTVALSSLGCSTMISAAYLAIFVNLIPFNLAILFSFLASLYLGFLNRKIPATVISAVLTSILTIVLISFYLSLPALMGSITEASDLFVYANVAWTVRFLPMIIPTCLSAGIIGCILNEFLF